MPYSSGEYRLMSKALHWVMALLILFLLPVGFFMAEMDFSPFKLQVYGLHKSFGMIVLMLVAVRILWRSLVRGPHHLATHQPWEILLAKLIHVLLYIGMLGMPLSGWLMSSAGDFPNSFFGLFDFPALTAKDEGLYKLMKLAHLLTSLALIGGVGLHVAGALKHHFIDRDETLRRMTCSSLGFLSGAVIAVFAFGLLGAAGYLFISGKELKALGAVFLEQDTVVEESVVASVATVEPSGWLIDQDKSSIAFTATQYGSEFQGSFSQFTGNIIFEPEQLESSHVRVEIDVTSLTTGSSDRDQQAKGAQWFDVVQFSKAVFEASKFSRLDTNQYIAHGSLMIRDVTQPFDLPFTLMIEDGGEGARRAVMEASVVLDRLAFGVGQGQWADTKAIGGNVSLDLHIQADQH